MLTFLPIILFYYPHKLYLLFFLMHLLAILNYANWISHKCMQKMTTVITIRIFAFLNGCILALLKAVCGPLKKILAVNIRN